MKHAAYFALTLAVLFSFFTPKARGNETEITKAILILDASGSMWGQIDGVPKIDIARKAVANIIGKLDENLHLGLMVYGHRKRGDCADIELLVSPGPVNKEAMIGMVNAVTPRGRTPLTASLLQAAEVLRHGEGKATVILVSDGIETCGMDPCEAAAELEKTGVDFTAHVIGFDLADDEQAAIRCIADSTGGEFIAAADAASLASALTSVMTKTADPEAEAPPAPDPGPEPEPESSPEPVAEVELSKVTFRSLLAEEGEEVKSYYTILTPTDNERVAAGAGSTFDLKPGKYLVRAKSRDTQIERTVEIPQEPEFETVLIFNAGLLNMKTLADEGGDELKAYYTVSRAGADLQGKRPRVAAGASGEFLLPAGEYHVAAKWGDVTVDDLFEVTPNELTEGVLIAGAGILNMTASLGEDGEKADVYYTVRSGKQKLDGSRDRIAAGAGGQFRLPAGTYQVEAKWGDVTAAADVEVKASQTTSANIPIPGGLLRTSVKNAAGEDAKGFITIYSAKVSITGERTRVSAGAGSDFKIPEGDYVVEAKMGNEVISANATVKTGEATEVTLQSSAEK